MAYDEAASLGATVGEIHAELVGSGQGFEVLIVDDGSRDGTGEEADRLGQQLPGVRVIHHDTNLGLGGVYRTGFREATGSLITFFPADGQFPASIIGQFLALMGGRDMVLGHIDTRQRSLSGRALSSIERVLYRALFGPLPRFQGILMFRRELLERFVLRSEGRAWTVLIELIIRARRAGCELHSVQTPFRPRHSGDSKVQNPRTIWANAVALFRLRLQLQDRRA